MAARIKIYKTLLVVVVTGIIGVMIIFGRRSRHVSESERVRSQITDFKPIDIEKYEKCDQAFLPDSGAMLQSGYNIPVTPYDALDRFTVLTMVFNRFQSYREVIQHYICMPFVDRLVLLWANQEVDPPTKESMDVNCSDKFFVHRLKSAALTKRFANFSEIQTDAVFNVDDDKLVPVRDLKRGFNVWKKYPWGIVGNVARGCSGTAPNLTYEADLVSSSYGIILTSASFFHREYLRLFDEKCPAELRTDIDQNKNCEDILMNFLVKEHCKCSGVFYAGPGHFSKPKNIPHSTKLSSRKSHHRHRTVCLRKIMDFYSKSVNFTASRCIYS